MRTLFAIGACLTLAGGAPAWAADDFYAGKTVRVYLSGSAGGGYDGYGRLLGRHIAKHLPGEPTVVGVNMSGAGGRKLANYLYNAAPKDGTAIAIIHNTTVYDAMYGEPSVKFDASRFYWLGSLDSFTPISFVWHTSGVRSLADAKDREVAVGATGAGSSSFQYPNLLNNVLGTKFKIVTGYKGSPEMYRAMEQEETHGMMGTPWAQMRSRYMRWLKEDKVNILVQFGRKKNPDLLAVPLIMNFARSEDERKLFNFIFAGLDFSRPFLAPPGVPAERVATLRAAFDAAAADPELLAEARKAKRNVNPLSGAEVQAMVNEIYATPPALVKQAQEVLFGKK
ncbi:MAG: hypothetical protein GEU92_19905 [Alphaproteobacteria bacterium]|nr:hypothetical protein [Alphaproteobacteria bacterium]